LNPIVTAPSVILPGDLIGRHADHGLDKSGHLLPDPTEAVNQIEEALCEGGDLYAQYLINGHLEGYAGAARWKFIDMKFITLSAHALHYEMPLVKWSLISSDQMKSRTKGLCLDWNSA